MVQVKSILCASCRQPSPELKCDSCPYQFHRRCTANRDTAARNSPGGRTSCPECTGSLLGIQGLLIPEIAKSATPQAVETPSKCLDTTSDVPIPSAEGWASNGCLSPIGVVDNPVHTANTTVPSTWSGEGAVDPRKHGSLGPSGVVNENAVDAATTTALPSTGCGSGAGDLIVNNDFCEVCQKAGKLLLCEKCPRAFHVPCIERFIDDPESLAQVSAWACPVCNGIDVLRNKQKSSLEPEQLKARMDDAIKHSRKQKKASVRRRDCFLQLHLDLLDVFATKAACTRISNTKGERTRRGGEEVTMLEIGQQVTALGEDHVCYEGVVLSQDKGSSYVVVNLATMVEAVVERDSMAPTDANPENNAKIKTFDFLAHSRTPNLAEGTSLKDYQQQGVNWCIHAFYNRCGGILADDMGLGKTVQTLSVISYLRAAGACVGPFLVVCPLSCTGNWIREAKRFVPHLSVGKVCGTSREREWVLDDDDIWYGQKDIIITTYETVLSMGDYFERHVWALMVLDEAHRIKNEATRIREALDSVECSARLLLTGTPLQNHLGELFALLRFMWPDVLAKECDVFSTAVQMPTEKSLVADAAPGAVVDLPMVSKIKRLLAMLMIRRHKKDVVNLPPKVFRDIWLPMSPCQAQWYRTLLKCRKFIAEKGLRALLKLVTRVRLLSAHPRCLATKVADVENLAQYTCVDENALKKITAADVPMSDEVVAQSGKLVFVDTLLSHLHAQNMAFSTEWRRAFEDRLRKSLDGAEKEKGRSAKPKTIPRTSAGSWLKNVDGVLMLDEMRPWVEPKPSAAKTDTPVPSPCNELKNGDANAAPEASPGTSLEASNVENADENPEDPDFHTPRPHKVLIFSQFHACLDLLEAFCKWRGWRHLRLDGSTPRVLRELDMRDFNAGDEDYFVYLIGTRAGGLGINLATANHVVLFDQDWNPFVDFQAVDRAHRIGQNRTVNVYRLIQEWGVDEKLAHRQQQKLDMEQTVIKSDSKETNTTDDFLEPADANERLSADDIINLLRHGEQVLRNFEGENMMGKPLAEFLQRVHRPLPTHEEAAEELPSSLGQLDGTFVVDDGEDASHVGKSKELEEETGLPTAAASQKATKAAAPARTPPPPPPEVPVMRTASGRAIRAPKAAYVPDMTFTATKQSKPKIVFKHCHDCFVCGKGVKALACKRKGQDLEQDGKEIISPVDTLCDACPKAYHSACLLGLRSGREARGRWTCGWHMCGMCDRSASACGGMLMHCAQCPTALCYDCFPANFRRVYPPDKFFTELNFRGWKVSPKEFVTFQCNACRALEEQKKRQLMRAEELEARQDERKRAALEEKRNLVSTKKRMEGEEARRRMRQLMLEHERSQLLRDLSMAQSDMQAAAEALWPPVFWKRWLALCAQEDAAYLSTIKGTQKKLTLEMEKRSRPMLVCDNCGFPGHRARQCMFPLERTTQKISAGVRSDNAGAVGARGRPNTRSSTVLYKKMCGLCSACGHQRIVCPSLTPEQKAEYVDRIVNFGKLRTDFLREGTAHDQKRPPEPSISDSSNGKLYQLHHKKLTNALHGSVEEALVRCGLESYVDNIVTAAPPVPVAGAARAKAKPKAKSSAAFRRRRDEGDDAYGAGRKKKLGLKMAKRAIQRHLLKGKKNGSLSSVARGRAAFAKRAGEPLPGGPQKKKLTLANGAGKERQQQSHIDERILVDGVASGWSLRGTVNMFGACSIVFKPPQTTRWWSEKQVQETMEKPVLEALEAEKVDILKSLSSRPPAPKPSPRAVPPPDDNLTEAREITAGAAKGWVIRASANGDKGMKYTWRPPGSTRWLLRGQAQKQATNEVWQLVEITREAIADRIRNALAENAKQKTEVGVPLAVENPEGEDPEEADEDEEEYRDDEDDEFPRPSDRCRPRLLGGRGGGRIAATKRPPRPQQQERRQRTVMGGAAHGWCVRVYKVECGNRIFSFKKPNSNQWLSASVVASEIDVDIAAALDLEKQKVLQLSNAHTKMSEHGKRTKSLAGYNLEERGAAMVEPDAKRANVVLPKESEDLFADIL